MPSLTLLRTESAPSRRRPFAVGFFLQIVFLLILIRVAAYTPKLMLQKPHESVVLIAPRLEEPPAPRPHQQIVAPKLPKLQPRAVPTPTPDIEPPKVEAKIEPPKPLPTPPTPAPVRHVETNTFANAAPTPAPPAPPKPEVKTNLFAGAAAQPTVKAPVQQVQTGGFGNPVGAKGSTTEEAKLNAPKLGAFDKASGPGDGNGTAGTHGRPGVVASAGFGDGGVAASGNRNIPGGGVHEGGFGDASVASGNGPATRAKPDAPAMTPVQILEKPQPVYTKEARDLKIEGEVHLKVLFQADGHVQVLQVVQGLGHGLDQAAEAAAQKIRFKPAQRDGRPCDMTATVHILFQLAS